MSTTLGGITERFIEEVHTEEPVELVQKVDTVNSTGWTFSLRDMTSIGVSIKEFGQEYQYKEILTPNNEKTGLYTVCCLLEGSTKWVPLNGVLTRKYVIASSEKFINLLQDKIKLTEEPKVYIEPFRSTWLGSTNYDIKTFDDDDASMIFSIITGIDGIKLSSVKSKLNIAVVNSYNGSRSLRLDYVVNTIGSINNSDSSSNTTHKMKDFFTLCNFSSKFIHAGSLQEIDTDVTSIQANVDHTIQKLKSYNTNIEDIIEKISKNFKKETRDHFQGQCSNLQPAYKNLYFILLITSVLLERNYTVLQHINIQSTVDKLNRIIFKTK